MKVAFASCVASAAAGGLIPLTWSDCSDETYKTKISNLAPLQVETGKITTLTGSGHLLEDIAEDIHFDGRFELQLDDCIADAGVGTKCDFPLDTGHISIKGLDFPVKAGRVPFETGLRITRDLPASSLNTTSQITAVSKSKGTLFCIDVETTRSPDSHFGVGILDVTWSNCGGVDAMIKVDSLTPSQIKQGEETTFVGSGMLLEDIDEDDIQVDMRVKIALIDCPGTVSNPKKCNFPIDLGYMQMHAIPTPLKAGDVDVDLDLKLSIIVPVKLAPVSTTHVHAWTDSGDKVFCLDVFTGMDRKESDVSV
jgi:hypothetical protein